MMEPKSRRQEGRPVEENGNGDLLARVELLGRRLGSVESAVARLHEFVEGKEPVLPKEWYTTAELAKAVGVSQYTVQARWCATGRIECGKDPDTQKWRIPAGEYTRLVRGGSPRAGRLG